MEWRASGVPRTDWMHFGWVPKRVPLPAARRIRTGEDEAGGERRGVRNSEDGEDVGDT